MDIISTILSNINPLSQSSASGSSTDLPEQFLSDLGKHLTGKNLSTNTGGIVTAKGGNTYVIKLPSLSNVIKDVQSLTIKTDKPIDNIGNFKITPESYSINNVNKNPTLNISGTITQISTTTKEPQVIKFTSDIPINPSNAAKSSNATNTTGTANTAGNQQPANVKLDGVNLTEPSRPNLLNLGAYTNKVSSDVAPKISNLPTYTNFKPNSLTSYNLQVSSFTYPSGKTIDIGQNNQLIQSQPQNLISGNIEFSPQNRETVIKTEFGNFRVPGELSLPNGSAIKFMITNISNIKPEAQINESFNLNLNSVKFALEGEGSALQNLINNLMNLPHGNSLLHKLFPNFSDKGSFARSLWFISSSINSSPDAWLGPDGKSFIKANFPNSDSVFTNLKEVFSLLKNLNSNPQATQNPDSWYNYLIPFYDNKKLEFVSFYIQPKEKGLSKEDKNNSRKFIVEFEQSELGQVVIEGLFVESGKKVKHLDLQLSSEKGFSQELTEELTLLFSSISEGYGFDGKIDFLGSIPSDYQKVLSQRTSGDGIVI